MQPRSCIAASFLLLIINFRDFTIQEILFKINKIFTCTFALKNIL